MKYKPQLDDDLIKSLGINKSVIEHHLTNAEYTQNVVYKDYPLVQAKPTVIEWVVYLDNTEAVHQYLMDKPELSQINVHENGQCTSYVVAILWPVTSNKEEIK